MTVLNRLDDRHDTSSSQPLGRSSFRTSMHKGNAERVDDVLKRLRFVTGVKSDRELSLRFGYSATAMTNKRQRGSVPYDECVQVAEERGISLDWLILGKGEPPAELAELASPVAGASQTALSGEDAEFVSVPLYDIQAAAGNGRLFEAERIKYYVHFRRDWLAREGLYPKDLACIEVDGDSMEETLHDRDTVLVNRARVRGDGVYLLRMGEALRIKRLQWLADRSLRLSSDNERYAPEVILPEDLSQVEVLGHCHWRAGKIF